MKPVLPIVLVLAGCAIAPPHYPDSEMLIAASALTKLAIAVDGTTRYGKVPATASGEDLLALATADDPALLQPLARFRIKVRRQGLNSAVLLCSPDASVALLEDAGCTAASDLPHWRTQPQPPCDFALNLDEVCQAR